MEGRERERKGKEGRGAKEAKALVSALETRGAGCRGDGGSARPVPTKWPPMAAAKRRRQTIH